MSFAPETDARRRGGVWSTASIRLAALYALLIALAGAALTLGIDYALIRFMEAETRDGLQHQMDVMLADANSQGTAALVQELQSQPTNMQARRYLFLVQAPDGSVFSNGLTESVVDDTGFRRNLPAGGRAARWPDQTPDMLSLGARAADGGLLGVGRDAQHLRELRAALRGMTILTGAALVTLTLLGGLVAGGVFLRRLDGVNRAVARIIDGERGGRLPSIGFGREFDTLADNLNTMLDRQESAHEALRTMSESIAHELRAPLNRLRNRLEEIERQSPDNPAVERAAEEMTRLDALFGSLLTLARLETAAERLDRRPVDAAELTANMGEIYGPAAEEAGGALHARPASEPLMIRADAALIQQALANLVENAIFHAGPAPTITLSCQRDGDAIVIAVADNGPGVAAEEREKIVRRFYRGETGATTQGSGLGLTMVAAVAQAHGGRLVLSDNAPGLRAELRLPTA